MSMCNICGQENFKGGHDCPKKPDVSAVPSNDGLACPDKIADQLVRLAAEMATRQGMPSEYAEDWPIPKSTPKKTLYEIERNMEIIQKKIADWSYTVRQLANRLNEAK